MKKVLRFGVVLLCVIIFSSLLFIAVKQTDLTTKDPKTPISADFMVPTRSIDPTSIMVELPENHNADEIVMYFGDELGHFEPAVASFDVTEQSIVCAMPGDLVAPDNATMIWVYTANERGVSEKGISVSLMHAPNQTTLDDGDVDEQVKNVEIYAVIVIASALLISFIGYMWLGKKTDAELKTAEKEGQE